MNEFTSTLIQCILVATVPVCAAFLGNAVKAIAHYLGVKSDNALTRKYLDAVADAVANAVTYTSQVYVDKLKEQGQFTEENQREALRTALDQAKSLLTAEAIEYLDTTYGDLNEYLKSRIEAEVRNQKQGVTMLRT